jgi:hypothetical protein
LRDRLAQAYADPAAAEAAWQHLARERGLTGAMAAVARDPASLGPLKGRRILFGLIANRERADAAAAARLVPDAAAKAWNTAIARDLDRAASYRLDHIEAGPEMTSRRQALAERGTEHTARELRDQAAALRRNADLAELYIAIRQAREIAPNPKNPATLAISWAANLAAPELARITELATLYKAACRSAMAAEFRSRDPGAFDAWERVNQRSIQHDRGPSLGR